MAEHPLLRLPEPERVAPPRRGGGGPSLTRPSRERQGVRLGPKFDRVARVMEDPTQAMELRADPNAIAPERAIVFELISSLPEFYREASQIGLEYLDDEELEIEPDEDFQISERPDESISGRIYLAMPDTNALNELIRLWRRYKARKRMPNGFAMWTKLFGMLKDVRAWGPQDRLLPETLEAWRERLDQAPTEPVRFEVELWFRGDESTRARISKAFHSLVVSLDGAIVNRATIPEIRYDAALVDLPAVQIEKLIAEPTVTLARNNDVMFIRPQSTVDIRSDEEQYDELAPLIASAPPSLPPIAALLDGFPVQNHQCLANRLDVDDPEDLAPKYDNRSRKHGTEMASLILHGDLNCGPIPLRRRLHVRPVMRSVKTPNGWLETTPNDRLLVDDIFRAVRRIKEGEADTLATAPTVFLINISLGDSSRPFAGPISPWARALDYLAHRYRVLFLVSAGNIMSSILLPDFSGWTAFENADSSDRERALFSALNNEKSYRTLLSPAEAMNVLTVGSCHSDSVVSGGGAAMAMDAITSAALPNMSSALGLGYKKIIKPEFLAEGGREYTRFAGTNSHLRIEPSRIPGQAYGLRAAVPDLGGDTRRTALAAGTSVSTAIATRAGHLIFEALMDRAGGSMLSDIPSGYYGLVVKALLVHSTEWGSGAQVIEELSDTDHYVSRDNISRFLGHGVLNVDRAVACTAERATLVGYGDIAPGTANLYRIPLPPSLDGVQEYRAVTVTLAWFAPINPRHQNYRMIALEAKPGRDSKFSLGVERDKMQPHDRAVARGTIFHDRRIGWRAAPFVDGGDLHLRVTARETAGNLQDSVPFAVAVSIAVGVDSSIPVYSEVRAAVMSRIRPPITP